MNTQNTLDLSICSWTWILAWLACEILSMGNLEENFFLLWGFFSTGKGFFYAIHLGGLNPLWHLIFPPRGHKERSITAHEHRQVIQQLSFVGFRGQFCAGRTFSERSCLFGKGYAKKITFFMWLGKIIAMIQKMCNANSSFLLTAALECLPMSLTPIWSSMKINRK